MEMTFGEAHDIWSRVVRGDVTLTQDEVKAAAQWFDDFIGKLNDKYVQSKQESEEVQRTQQKDAIDKKRKSTESEKRQLEDFIRKHDNLINWLNKQN